MTRIRTTLIVLVASLALGLIAAGCGGSGEPPNPSALVVDSARALREQKPARFAYDTQIRVDEVVPAAGADPSIRQFTSSPASLGLKGGFSPEAITAKGSAQGAGQTFTAEAQAGANEVYVRFLGQWYGSKNLGLRQLRQRAEQTSGRSSSQAFDQAISNIERYGDQIFQGEVSEGPELDGATWQTEGTLNVDGLIAIAENEGETVEPQDREILEKIAQGTRVTYVISQDDKLPRRVVFAVDLKPAELAEAAGEGNEEVKDIERVKASLTVNMSKWGEPVEIRPPGNFQPLEQLVGQFLGGASSGTAPQPSF